MKPVITCAVHYEQQCCPSLPPPRRHPSSPSSRPGAVNTQAGGPPVKMSSPALPTSNDAHLSSTNCKGDKSSTGCNPQDSSSHPHFNTNLSAKLPSPSLQGSAPEFPPDPPKSPRSRQEHTLFVSLGGSSPSSLSLWTRPLPHQPPRLAPGVCGSSQLPLATLTSPNPCKCLCGQTVTSPPQKYPRYFLCK